MKKIILLFLTAFFATSLAVIAQNSDNKSDISVNFKNQNIVKSETNKNAKKIQLLKKSKTMRSAQKGKTYKNVGVLKTASLEVNNLKAKASPQVIQQSFENVKLRIDNMETKELAVYKEILIKKFEVAKEDGVKGQQVKELQDIIKYINKVN